ncbi:MAG: hypothetical protein ACM3SY_22770 [Candidatus Omnitrophota bacterium]
MNHQRHDEISEVMEVIEDRFSRCPHCRSFSVSETTNFTPQERIKSLFVTVAAFKCGNCFYRFVEYGKLSDSLKERKGFWAVFVIVVVLMGILFFLPSSDNSLSRAEHLRKSLQVSDPKSMQSEPFIPPKDLVESKPNIPAINAPVHDIILGNSKKFGVNWGIVPNGVKIERLSAGPLQRAGLKIGDVFSEINNQKITGGGILSAIRDDIRLGKREEAILKVYRGNQSLYYRMVKEKRKENKENENSDAIKTSILYPQAVPQINTIINSILDKP